MGNKLLLITTANNDIDVAIKTTFKLEDNPVKESIRAYKIKPTEKIPIGTSKVCYIGKEYQVTCEIVSAGFKNEKTTNH
ncbi:hypothetical protein [Pontimicrobium aquaticum]|uniref:Uncharacterized protein n=1 Tax=Pontimicrobium aquaticum TaxID=2565367 RepID=A0A4U0F1B5_9FLAO|nr:hypothetical protein [Pontimicrobium aquaticum]TJY38217.1 hypothetical protein E5167_02895 [Pontimicrobium aquaticum]